MSWKCLAMSVASTAPMIDLRASLNCGYIRHTLYMNSLLELPPSRQVRKAITAVCLLCACYLLVLLTTYYLLPTAYSLLLCLLCLLATCRSSRQASMEQSGRSSSSLKSDAAWWLSSTCVASSKQ